LKYVSIRRHFINFLTKAKLPLENLHITVDKEILYLTQSDFKAFFASLPELKSLHLGVSYVNPEFFEALANAQLEAFTVCFTRMSEEYKDMLSKLTLGLAPSYMSLKQFGFEVKLWENKNGIPKSSIPVDLFRSLGDLIAQFTSLTSLRLWSYLVACTKMQVMFEKLTHIKSLKSLDLYLSIAGSQYAEVEAFSRFSG